MDGYTYPHHRWEWHPAHVVQARGPEMQRPAEEHDPPPPPKQPLGFAPPPKREVDEPQVWEGDGA